VKLGYNRHFPSNVVYGPVCWGGLGIQLLAFIQGYQHLKLLLGVLNTDTKVTPLLITLLRHTAMEAGTNTLFNGTTYHINRVLQYLTPTWVTHTLRFLADHSINTNLHTGNFMAPLQREWDAYLMDLFLARRPNYSISDLRALNRVRMHLQVYSKACVTDRVTGNLDVHLMTKRHSWMVRRSTFQWPIVVPKPYDWEIWAAALRQAFEELGTDDRMGLWQCTHQHWPMWTHPPPGPTLLWNHDPAWKAIVTINGVIIDRLTLHDMVHRQVHGPDLRAYIRYRLGWTEEQFDAVNWKALTRVLTATPLSTRTTTMKAIYCWLHTSHWQVRIYGTTSRCAMCSEVEDNTHLWICPAQVIHRTSALQSFINILKDRGSPPPVCQAFNDRLALFLSIPLETTIGRFDQDLTDPLSILTRNATFDQESLGWDNFLRGRHSLKWEEVYDEYLTIQQKKRRHKYTTGRTWATHVAREGLILLTTIWRARNTEIHEVTGPDKSLSDQLIHTRVRETYATKHLYPELTQHHMFHKTEEECLQQSSFKLIKWLETVDRLQFTFTADGSNQDIYQYFHPIRPRILLHDLD